MQAAGRRAIFTPNSSAARLPDSVTAFDEISSAARGSNIWRRGRSFAATVPSDFAKPQGGNRRVSKEERHAMLKSFVDKYRASNEGRFPSISHAVKEVGGSYYVARKILQEIEHSYKVLPASKKDDVPVGNARVDGHQPFEVKKKSQIFKIEKHAVKTYIIEKEKHVAGGGIEKITEEKVADHSVIARRDSFNEPIVEGVEIPSQTGESSYNSLLGKGKEDNNFHPRQTAEISLGIKEGPSGLWQSDISIGSSETTKTSLTSSKTSSITTAGAHKKQIKLKNEAEVLRFRKNDNAPERLHDSVGLNSTSTQRTGHEDSQSDDTHGEASTKLEHKEPTEKRSTVWGNLKSFADDFINFWRKM
ncbi:uncharacterized protein [Aristolochia californica]|uniref:uncharacterized protein isoform X2 n=1 Tax=Aristolochia californica TaxID=171875 RepID=UPI0035DAE0D7